MRIKVIKCTHSSYWYASKIGQVFDVEDDGPSGYIQKNSFQFFDKDDCEVIEEGNNHFVNCIADSIPEIQMTEKQFDYLCDEFFPVDKEMRDIMRQNMLDKDVILRSEFEIIIDKADKAILEYEVIPDIFTLNDAILELLRRDAIICKLTKGFLTIKEKLLEKK